MNARRGRAVTLVVVLATVVAVVVAAGWFFREPIAERMLAGLDETHVGTVGPDGFDETYDHSRAGRDARLRVMVPPGAAPEGTEVRVRVVSDRTRLGVEVPEGLLQATGLSADIELDGGALQPAEPVLVEIATPAEQQGGDPVVAATRTDGVYEPLTTTSWGEGAQVIHRAEMAHLSLVTFFRVDVGGVLDGIRGAWDSLLGRSAQPECVGRTVTVNGRDYSAGTARKVEGSTITAETSDAVWPCLDTGPSGEMVLALHSNSPVGWKVRADPRPVSAWATGTAINDLISGVVAHSVTDLSGAEGFVLPGMTTHLVYDQPARQLALTQDPLPGLLMALAYGIDQAMTVMRGAPVTAGDPPIDRGVRSQVERLFDEAASSDQIASVMAGRDIGDCFLALLDHMGDSEDTATLASGVITCFQAVLGDGPLDALLGVALGTLTGGVQLVAGNLMGAWQTVTGDHRVAVVVTGGAGDDDEAGPSPGGRDAVGAGGGGHDAPMDAGMRILQPTWQRHGARLVLLPDWTGSYAMNSGAVTGGEWAVTWERISETEVEVTIGDQTSSYERSLGESGPVPGATYRARMSPDGATLQLTRTSGTGFESVELCSSEAMTRQCGA